MGPPEIGILSLFVGLPTVILGFILGSKYLKVKEILGSKLLKIKELECENELYKTKMELLEEENKKYDKLLDKLSEEENKKYDKITKSIKGM
jgi:hypothetical protein